MAKAATRTTIIGLAFFMLSILPEASHSFKQADVDKLLNTGECQWCDLTGADLTGKQLAGADLAGANLSQAKLAGADLSNANLATTYLRKTDLSRANLSGAFLDKANLNGANMEGASLTNTSLSGATWTDGSKCENRSMSECVRSDVVRPKDESPPLFPSDYQAPR